jgi:ubiquinone/menaquinone biosynthesis C-methylase UbiE
MKLDYNSLAQEYAWHRQIHLEVIQNLVKAGGLGLDAKVLDVGCGTGNYTLALEETIHCSCWGLDPSEQMLVKARERIRDAHFKTGRAEQLEYPAEFFDLVFSVDVIHHVSDRASFFREAYRVLKNGGKVCTVTDSEDIIHHRRPLSNYFPETVEIELQRYPPIMDLRAMMISAGFADLQEVVAEREYELQDIQKYRDKAFSSLHLISEEAFERGIQRLERDVQAHPIPAISLYLLLWGVKGSS